ncbi:ribonuclease D [Mycobacteroides abscessus subsp. abscessus]|nr:ribonuclease D [Mycobacteroides abscessus subsp. abscessus]
MAELSTEHAVPVENLLSPDLVRRLCWDGLPDYDRVGDPGDLAAAIDGFLKSGGARPWQRELTVPRLTLALTPPASA